MVNELSLNQQLAQAVSSFATLSTYALWPRANVLYAWQHMAFGPTTKPLYSVKTDISVCNRIVEPKQLKYSEMVSLSMWDFNMTDADSLALELEKIGLTSCEL